MSIPGLGERRSSNIVFLSIVGSEFARRHEKHITNEKGERITEERAELDKAGNPTGKVFIEEYFGSVKGIITKAEIEQIEFSPGRKANMLKLTLAFEDYTFQVSTSAGSGYAKSLYKRLPAVHPDQEVILEPYAVEDKGTGKTNRGVTVRQNNQKIEALWNKVTPGFPPAVQTTDEFGNPKWDFTEQNRFLYIQFNMWAQKLGTINPGFQVPQGAQAPPAGAVGQQPATPTPTSTPQSPHTPNVAQGFPTASSGNSFPPAQGAAAPPEFDEEDDDLPF